MRKNHRNAFGIALLVMGTVPGCSGPISTREKAAMVGTGVGAAIGGAVGLGAGALVGDHLQREE